MHPYISADTKFNIFSKYKYHHFLKPNYNGNQYGGIYYTRGSNTFDMRIDNNDNNDNDKKTTIFIGNRKQKVCLIGTIENYDEVLLQSFGYYKECSISENLERKTGVINMMNAFIDFLKDKFPNIKKIILQDYSSFECSKETKIQTYLYYLLKYGSSYYEKIHGFQLKNELKKNEHLDNIKKTRNIKLKNIPEFIEFIQKNDIYKKINMEVLNKFIIKINNFNTINDFINNIKFNDEECKILNYLLEYLKQKYNIQSLHSAEYEKNIQI